MKVEVLRKGVYVSSMGCRWGFAKCWPLLAHRWALLRRVWRALVKIGIRCLWGSWGQNPAKCLGDLLVVLGLLMYFGMGFWGVLIIPKWLINDSGWIPILFK